jgi:hypothetical protein
LGHLVEPNRWLRDIESMGVEVTVELDGNIVKLAGLQPRRVEL